jgi:hypothetical protein
MSLYVFIAIYAVLLFFLVFNKKLNKKVKNIGISTLIVIAILYVILTPDFVKGFISGVSSIFNLIF